MATMQAKPQELIRPPDPGLSSRTYAESLKTNIKWDSRLKRNVLEIAMESDNSEFIDIPDGDINRLFKTIGIDVKAQIEGYFRRGSKIFAWLANGIDLDRFCKAEAIRINNKLRTKFIRPAGKKEVTVKVCGLDFNTPDSYVIEYLSKFGKVVSDSVIYDKYKEGPFVGKFNGDRKYVADFTSSSVNMGTFHIIDGARVKIFFNGNRKTCARCHLTSDQCKGEAQASNCEELGGIRLSLLEHMKRLWETVNFQPIQFKFDVDDEMVNNLGGDVQISEKSSFSPGVKRPDSTEEDVEKYTGVVINNFPPKVAKADLIKFLKKRGLPKDFSSESVMLSDTEKGTNVEITKLHGDLVKSLISNIHFIETRTKFFDRPLYCRAIRDLTPKKSPTTASSRMEVSKSSLDSDINSEDDLDSYDFTEDVSISKSPSGQLFKKVKMVQMMKIQKIKMNSRSTKLQYVKSTQIKETGIVVAKRQMGERSQKISFIYLHNGYLN